MANIMTFLFLWLMNSVVFSSGMKLLDIVVPSAVLLGQDVLLECRYDLQRDGLYSLKWYKGNEEIFRYIPGEELPSDRIKGFNLPGVNIIMEKSNEHQILLHNVNFDSTGKYRCEIVAEAPSFQTMSSVGQMNVVQLPAEDPVITGGLLRYTIGDTVRVNCTSRKSLPAANLTWYINGEMADRNFLHPYPIIEDEETGLQSVTLGLEFRVRQKHLKSGGLKIKCTATLAALYWRSDERSAEAAAMRSSHNHAERDTQETLSTVSHEKSNWLFNLGGGATSISPVLFTSLLSVILTAFAFC